VKLSPNVTDIREMARVCEGEGADGLSLVNTLQALDIDIETRRPVLSNVLGGLSGPAIRPVALRMVWQASQAVRIPICGIGGIMNAEDAIKFLICGATAVQVGHRQLSEPAGGARSGRGYRSPCAAARRRARRGSGRNDRGPGALAPQARSEPPERLPPVQEFG